MWNNIIKVLLEKKPVIENHVLSKITFQECEFRKRIFRQTETVYHQKTFTKGNVKDVLQEGK